MATPELPLPELTPNPHAGGEGSGSTGVEAPQPILSSAAPLVESQPEWQSPPEQDLTPPAAFTIPSSSEPSDLPLSQEPLFPDAPPAGAPEISSHRTLYTLKELHPPFDQLPPKRPRKHEHKENAESFLTARQRKQMKAFYEESIAQAYEAERKHVSLGVRDFVQTLSDADCLKIVLSAIEEPPEYNPNDVRLQIEFDHADPKDWMDMLRVLTIGILQHEVISRLRSYHDTREARRVHQAQAK